MATTSPDNIWSADGNTAASLEAITAAMAASIQEALLKRANTYLGTSAERSSFTNDAPEGTLWADSNGEKAVYKKTGSNWDKVYPISVPGAAVRAAASGSHVFKRSETNDETMSATITLPEGVFTKPPRVSIAVATSVPANCNAGFSYVTTSDFNLHLWRKTKVDTTVHWTALQLDSQ